MTPGPLETLAIVAAAFALMLVLAWRLFIGWTRH